MSEEKDTGAQSEAAPEQRTYSTQQARQGDVVLRRWWERKVFIAGLAGFVVLVLVLGILA